MKEMKTLKLPGQNEPYEIVDAYAREQLANKQNGAGKNVEGNVYGVPADKTLSEGTEKTAGKGAEIFNCYEDDIENNVYANIAVGEYSHAEGAGTIALGEASHAEGSASIAFDYYSHAEGMWTMALGEASHAEGCSTTASGVRAHAEGYGTIASGACAHAEGASTQATGNFSHVEGLYTEVHGECSHVQGKYNIIDETEIDGNHTAYVHIVGNGTEDARSNAHTLDWSGNAWFAGDVYVGSTSGTNKDNGSKKLITESEVDTKLAALVNSAPEKLNTLDELAAALGDDENFANTVTTELSKKANTSDLGALATKDSLTASDVGALPDTTVIPSIEGLATESYVNTQVSSKQDAITGTAGQFVVIGSDGKPTTKTIAYAEEVSF